MGWKWAAISDQSEIQSSSDDSCLVQRQVADRAGADCKAPRPARSASSHDCHYCCWHCWYCLTSDSDPSCERASPLYVCYCYNVCMRRHAKEPLSKGTTRKDEREERGRKSTVPPKRKYASLSLSRPLYLLDTMIQVLQYDTFASQSTTTPLWPTPSSYTSSLIYSFSHAPIMLGRAFFLFS